MTTVDPPRNKKPRESPWTIDTAVTDTGTEKVSVQVYDENVVTALQQEMDVLQDKDGTNSLAECFGQCVTYFGGDKSQRVVEIAMEFDCGGGDKSSGQGLSSPKEEACEKVVASDGELTVGQAVKELKKMVAKEEGISAGIVYRRVGEHDTLTVSVMQMGGEPAVHWDTEYEGTGKESASFVTLNFKRSEPITVRPVQNTSYSGQLKIHQVLWE